MTTTADRILAGEEMRNHRAFLAWASAVGVLLLLALLPLWNPDSFLVYIATVVFLYLVGGFGMHLIMRTGLIPLGQAAFVGIGGYVSALLTTRFGISFWLAFAAAGMAAGLVAAVVGPIILRLRGVYFVLITFTLGEIVRLVFVEWSAITGGSDGISRIPSPSAFFSSPFHYYYLALAVAAASLVFSLRLMKSEFGQAMDAIGESETLAAATGVPVYRVKITVFIIGCVLAGLQGSLTAHFIRFIAPQSFSFSESLNFLVMNVIGGTHSLWGPIIGTIFIVALPELLRQWVELQWILYGIALICVMRFFPGGLAELGTKLRDMAVARMRAGS
ncbi:branched-chain amino acid ABC transporter permease [Bradyrhizobium sp. NP1]|uniref:branched-chain amino acid ABC transporter permease n=1 Tax=Bradyrhizobium sp. NP1 TaxID=3049772 RepID=UPI0025A52516|nr:branched-chain amino acid ABC transporter permease [Bradyrhizobium sp. NP1]WJR77434.1 branched-chain amino acid ABC transporter permease [Bradyrhizobium sp. NP1]